jgi:hypothetical protein
LSFKIEGRNETRRYFWPPCLAGLAVAAGWAEGVRADQEPEPLGWWAEEKIFFVVLGIGHIYWMYGLILWVEILRWVDLVKKEDRRGERWKHWKETICSRGS